MPRPLRLDPPGTWHHIMNRGARHQTIFIDDRDRRDFVDLLAQLEVRFEVEVHLFCLVGNHYHLLVRSRAGRISDAMKFLSERFTRLSNRRHGHDGPIFRGRFHSQIVVSDRHHRWLFRYIHANARDAGWNGPLHTYPWSSLATMLHGAASGGPYPWLNTAYFNDLFAGDHVRMLRYAEGSQWGSGVPEAPLQPPLPGEQQPPSSSPTPSLDDEVMITIRGVVLDCVQAEIDDLDHARPGLRSDARQAAALLAVDVAHLRTEQVARSLGLSSPAACRVLVHRARKRRVTDLGFAVLLAEAASRFDSDRRRLAA